MKLHIRKLRNCVDDDKTIESQTASMEREEADSRTTVEVSLSPYDYYKAGVQDLGDLLHLTGYTVLQRASQTLSEARRVIVITTLEDRCVLVPMQHAAVQCSFNWRFHDGFREDMGPTLDFKSADVVVVISTAPHHPYNTLGAWLARDVGARVIGITDALDSPVGCLARDVLIVPIPQRGLFKS